VGVVVERWRIGVHGQIIRRVQGGGWPFPDMWMQLDGRRRNCLRHYKYSVS